MLALSDDDPLDVKPVAVAAGERLVHDEIFGATGQQPSLFDIPQRCPSHASLLEGESTKRPVAGDTVGGPQQSNPIMQGELAGIVDPSLEPVEQPVDDRLLIAETRQDGQVDVPRKSWLSPSKHGEPTHKTENPVALTAQVLNGHPTHEQRVHVPA